MSDESADTAESTVAQAQTIAVHGKALDSEVDDDATAAASTGRWRRMLAYGLLPALALLMALGAGYVKWQSGVAHESILARTQSVQAATESTIAMLSYTPDTAERDLGAARGRLTGPFRDSYSALVHDVVIPGALQKRVSAVATVPAAASVSATENHSVVIVFVDQTTTIVNQSPTDTASSVKVTLDKVDGRWLISDFTPV